MTRTFRPLALAVVAAAIFALGSVAPAVAISSGATATLTVNGTVTSNCTVNNQPSALNMSYDAVNNSATLGTSSFTWTCTNGSSVTITPSSPSASGSTWNAVLSATNLAYSLYNDNACTTNQLSSGTAYDFSGTGSAQTYNICGIPNLGQQNLAAGTYVDTVTFTFNYGP